MTRTPLAMFLAVMVLTLSAVPTSAQTIEEAKTTLQEAFAKVNSVTADVVMNMSMGPGMSMKNTGTVAMLRDGEKMKFRQELNTSLSGAPAGLGGEGTTVTLFDGENSYTILDIMGQRTALKAGPEDGGDVNAPVGANLWDSLEESFTLSPAGEERIDGEPCYVIKATPKDPETSGPSTYYFDKNLGVVRRVEMKVPDMPGMSTVNYSNFKVNEEVDPERFVFKPEPGMRVEDAGTFSLEQSMPVPEIAE